MSDRTLEKAEYYQRVTKERKLVRMIQECRERYVPVNSNDEPEGVVLHVKEVELNSLIGFGKRGPQVIGSVWSIG